MRHEIDCLIYHLVSVSVIIQVRIVRKCETKGAVLESPVNSTDLPVTPLSTPSPIVLSSDIRKTYWSSFQGVI